MCTDELFTIGPFLFTKLLIPVLLEGTTSSADRTSRIAFVASRAQTEDIQYNTLTDTAGRRKMPASARYAQSKFVCRSLDYPRDGALTSTAGKCCPFRGVCAEVWGKGPDILFFESRFVSWPCIGSATQLFSNRFLQLVRWHSIKLA